MNLYVRDENKQETRIKAGKYFIAAKLLRQKIAFQEHHVSRNEHASI